MQTAKRKHSSSGDQQASKRVTRSATKWLTADQLSLDASTHCRCITALSKEPPSSPPTDVCWENAPLRPEADWLPIEFAKPIAQWVDCSTGAVLRKIHWQHTLVGRSRESLHPEADLILRAPSVSNLHLMLSYVYARAQGKIVKGFVLNVFGRNRTVLNETNVKSGHHRIYNGAIIRCGSASPTLRFEILDDNLPAADAILMKRLLKKEAAEAEAARREAADV